MKLIKIQFTLKVLLFSFIVLTTFSANATEYSREHTARLNIIIKEIESQYATPNKAGITKREQLINEALKIDPNNKVILYHAAVLHIDLEQYQASLKITNKLLESDPENTSYLKLKKIATEKLAEIESALNQLQTKLAEQPDDVETRLELVSLEIKNRHYSRALSLINQGLQRSPNNTKLLYHKALLLVELERYQLALKITSGLLKNDPSNPEYLQLQETINDKLSIATTQIDQLKAQLNQEPNNVDLRLKIVAIEVQKHHYKHALASVNQGLKLDPDNNQLLYAHAELNIDIGHYSEAKKSLKRILENDPTNQSAIDLLATANKQGDDLITTKPQPKPKKIVIKKKEKPKALVKLPIKKPRKIDIPRTTREFAIALAPGKKKNAIMLIGNPVYISDKKQVWSYNSLIYGRKTQHGDYLFYLNNRTREDKFAFQGAFEVYPIINKNLYFNLGYAYSDSFLFPKHTAIARFAGLLKNNYEIISGGVFYRVVDFDLWAPELGIRKYFGHNFIAIKGIPYLSKVMKSVLLLQGTFRHYYNNDRSFFEIVMGAGNSPDLLELTSEGFVNMNTFYIYIKNEFPIANHLYMAVQLGYGDEEFPTFNRNRYSLAVSLTRRF